MAELADALDSGSSGKPCGFESLYPHQRKNGERAKSPLVVFAL